MKRGLPALAVAVVVASNAFLLAGVAWNRSGEPAAELELTERELGMPYRRWSGRESTGVSLSIRLAEQDHDWLDSDKLAELGFDVEDDGGEDGGRQRPGRRTRERQVHVVLEFDGPAFQALLEQRRERLASLRRDLAAGDATSRQVEAARSELDRLESAGSRLVAVDAGRSTEALRKRYPDRQRYAIMNALVRIHRGVWPGAPPEPRVRARVTALLPGDLHVPRRFHAPLREATGETRKHHEDPPRYRAVVRFGRRQEPWLSSIEPIPDAGGESAGRPSG